MIDLRALTFMEYIAFASFLRFYNMLANLLDLLWLPARSGPPLGIGPVTEADLALARYLTHALETTLRLIGSRNARYALIMMSSK